MKKLFLLRKPVPHAQKIDLMYFNQAGVRRELRIEVRPVVDSTIELNNPVES